jgi:hypothetical protein
MYGHRSPRRHHMRASVIADRCDLMQLRSAGQEDPLTHLFGDEAGIVEEPDRGRQSKSDSDRVENGAA